MSETLEYIRPVASGRPFEGEKGDYEDQWESASGLTAFLLWHEDVQISQFIIQTSGSAEHPPIRLVDEHGHVRVDPSHYYVQQ